MNLGIVETWSGRFDDAERRLSEGAALAQTNRPALSGGRVSRAPGFPVKLVSLETARERGRQAVALAERHGWDDRPILAPALGAVAALTIWTGEFDEAERWLRRAWEVAEPQIDPAAAVLLHLVTGMLHVGRGQQQAALDEFEAAVNAQSLLTGVHALAPLSAGWLAATQARLGMPDEARATLTGFSAGAQRGRAQGGGLSAEGEGMAGISHARAVICMAEEDPAAALDALRDVLDVTPTVDFPAFAHQARGMIRRRRLLPVEEEECQRSAGPGFRGSSRAATSGTGEETLASPAEARVASSRWPKVPKVVPGARG
jgi:LuxR family maltose regulon positive regulatory protein